MKESPPEQGTGIITSVRPSGKQSRRYDVFVDGEYAVTVHEDILIRYRLLKGRDVSVQQLKAAEADDIREEAYRKAVRWLGAKPRTEAEVRSYLHRIGCDAAAQDEIIGRLQESGIIDDEAFSKAWAKERLRHHGKGKRWIGRELLSKGVDRSIVNDALDSIDPDEERKAAAALAKKRWKQISASGGGAAARRKLYAYLARRGFSASSIREAVRAAAGGSGGFEEEIPDEFSGADVWDD